MLEPRFYLVAKGNEKGYFMSEKKNEFIRALAEFLVEDQSIKSINLQLGKEGAEEWAKLRRHTPLQGYPTVPEAIEILTEFLC